MAIPSIYDYVQNPDKTENNALVRGYECSPECAAEEFANTMDMYEIKTGRKHKDNSRLLYHMRQSFKPGEVDPVTANRIGYELALEYTGGKHAFVVATHTDKAHYHNHIIFNAFNLDSDGKFRDGYFNYRDVARISDRLCKEYELSVIDIKHGWRDPYNKWEKRKGIMSEDKPPSKRKRLEEIIGFCLDKQPKDFNTLLKYLEDYSCYAKRRGSDISITTPFSKKPIRISSLSVEFREDGIKAQITERQTQHQNNISEIQTSENNENSANIDTVENTENTMPHFALDEFVNAKPKAKLKTPFAPLDPTKPKELKLIIDIHNSLKATENIGYRKWAEKFNLEQMSRTLIFIEKHQLTLNELENMATQKPKTLASIKGEIANQDAQLKHISSLQRHIGTYGKTKEIYKQYKQSKTPEQFRLENEKTITDHEMARTYFDECGYGFGTGNNLPRIAELRGQYAKHDATKKSLWSQYHEIRNSDKEIDNAWANVKAILNLKDEPEIVVVEISKPDIETIENETPEIILPQNKMPELAITEIKKEPQIPEVPKRNRKRNDPSL